MKIAHIVCAFPPLRGGMGNSVYQFVQILSKIGHQATVFTPAYRHGGDFLNKGECFIEDETSKNAALDIQDKKFHIVRLKPFFRYGYAAFLPQLFWRLRSFDIIHLHYPFYGAAEIVLLKKIFLGKKMNLIVHYHMDTIGDGLKGFIFKFHRLFVLPLLIRLADIITCASIDYIKHSNLFGYFEKYGGKFRQTLFGVDLNQFQPRNNIFEHKEKTILFVGGLDRAHYFKGLDNLLKAVSKLKINNWNLVIVGDGDLRPRYENLCRLLNIAQKVKFAGSVSHEKLAEYYNNCYVLVLPSLDKSEAFGLVLLEAMASGKPVIASNLPGVRSVFKNGIHGLTVKPGDVSDLVSKLKALLSYEELAKDMGRAGRELAETRYGWDKVGERLDLIYHYVKYTPK
jgi:glycosyltransferase involved in cell wall biosynthesis